MHLDLNSSRKAGSLLQVADLAENGADRTKRVAACEYLHATTLWMIGEILSTAVMVNLSWHVDNS